MQRQRKREWPNETLGDLMNLLAAQGRTAKNASQRAKQKLKKTENHLYEKHILSWKDYVCRTEYVGNLTQFFELCTMCSGIYL